MGNSSIYISTRCQQINTSKGAAEAGSSSTKVASSVGVFISVCGFTICHLPWLPQTNIFWDFIFLDHHGLPLSLDETYTSFKLVMRKKRQRRKWTQISLICLMSLPHCFTIQRDLLWGLQSTCYYFHWIHGSQWKIPLVLRRPMWISKVFRCDANSISWESYQNGC